MASGRMRGMGEEGLLTTHLNQRNLGMRPGPEVLRFQDHTPKNIAKTIEEIIYYRVCQGFSLGIPVGDHLQGARKGEGHGRRRLDQGGTKGGQRPNQDA